MGKKLDTKLDAKQESGAMKQERKPGTFEKNDPRINREKGPGQRRKKFLLLADMRAVSGQDKSKDRGPRQKTLRKFLDKDPNGFFRRLMDAEHRYAALKAEREVAPGERVDMGSDKAVAVLSEEIRKFEAEQAAEDAELAKRPDAAAIGASLQNALKGALEREAKLIQELDELRGRP